MKAAVESLLVGLLMLGWACTTLYAWHRAGPLPVAPVELATREP